MCGGPWVALVKEGVQIVAEWVGEEGVRALRVLDAPLVLTVQIFAVGEAGVGAGLGGLCLMQRGRRRRWRLWRLWWCLQWRWARGGALALGFGCYDGDALHIGCEG